MEFESRELNGFLLVGCRNLRKSQRLNKFGSRANYGWLRQLCFDAGTTSIIGRPIYEFWLENHPAGTLTEFATFLTKYGVPLPVLARQLGTTKRRVRRMWSHYISQNADRCGVSWLSGRMPIECRIEFIEQVKHALDRLPDKPTKPRKITKSVKARVLAEITNEQQLNAPDDVPVAVAVVDVVDPDWPLDLRRYRTPRYHGSL